MPSIFQRKVLNLRLCGLIVEQFEASRFNIINDLLQSMRNPHKITIIKHIIQINRFYKVSSAFSMNAPKTSNIQAVKY